MSTITIFILYMQKLRHREVKELVQDHTARKWQTGALTRSMYLQNLCSYPVYAFLYLFTDSFLLV